jgi:autotransporter-associated beta strand protein
VNYDINTLTFQAGALGYVIDNSGGSNLTMEGGITDSATTTETINAPVILGTMNSNTQTWTVDGTQLNVNDPLTAAAGFTGFIKAGSGILQLGSATNSFGPITVAAGTLQQSAAGALPDVNYSITGGTLNFNDFNGTVGTITQNGSAVELGIAGSTNTVNFGAVTQTAGTFDLNGGTANLPSLTQNGGGTFSTDSGTAANFTGAVSQSAGTFNVNRGTAAGITTLTQSNGSTFTVSAAGTATVTGAVTQNDTSSISVTGAGSTLNTGDVTQNGTATFTVNAGTATTGTLTQNGTATFTVNAGTATTGALTQNGTGATSFSVDGGSTANVASINSTDTSAILSVGTTGTINDQTTSADTYAGLLTGTGGTFNLNGAGPGNLTLTNTGNATAFTSGNVNIDANNTLTGGTKDAGSLPTANYTVNGTLNANGDSFTATGLSGAGAITLGAGTMTLNETTGGPFTHSGTIAGTTGSSIVSASTNNQTQTLSGVISGATSIAANGGVLTLTGNNTYTGGTMLNTGGTVAIQEDDSTVSNLGASSSALTFNGGTLQINGTMPTGLNPARSVTFTANGGDIDAHDSGEVFTVSQNITGGGPLNINPNGGLGTAVLTGAANSYGATNITSGTLKIGNGTTSGTLGTGAITDNGSLVIDPATGATQTISNVISTTGSGTMEIGGTNTTVVLTGANTPATAPGVVTTIDSGNTLKGAAANLPGNVVANGTLDFTQATDATYSNTITGATTGAVIKDGAGTLTFSGTNNYAGATTVNASRLDINGLTTSRTITVAAKVSGSTKITGGTLGGNGTIVGDIINNNIVSPGTTSSPQAILNQTGNYTGNSGSTFVVSVNDDGSGSPTPGVTNSELSVTGAATLESGSNVMVNIEGNVVIGATYTLIHTTGGATVDSDVTIETNRAFVKAVLDDTATDIDYTLTDDFVHGGATYNQIQLGTYLNNNSSNTNSDFQAVLAALNGITDGASDQEAVNANDIAAQAQTNEVSTATLVGGGLAAVPEPNAIVLLMMGLFPFWKVFAGKSKRQ